MPRDGTETYILPFPDVVEDTTIESTVYNGFTNDVAQDLNTPRPIKFGGTGAVDAATARFNLATEIAAQVVTNYDSHLWVPGSFYSATTATGEPVDGHAFSGVAYIGEALANPPTNQNVTLEARDATDGKLYIRRKAAGVWGAWVLDTAGTDAATALKVAKAGDTMTGALLMPDGIVTAPAIGFSAETTTGMWRVSANQIGWTVAGVNKLTLAATTFTSQIAVMLPVANPTVSNEAAHKSYVDTRDNAISGNGQCLLTRTSATQLMLSPFNGNCLKINGVTQSIPAAGVTITGAPTVNNTLYYVYAWMNGATMTLEISTTGHSKSSTAGNFGVEIKTGDDTRSLVGMAYSQGVTGQWTDTPTLRLVRSWFNDYGVTGQNGAAGAVTNSLGALVDIGGTTVNIVSWLGENFMQSVGAQCYMNTVGQITYVLAGLDGTASLTTQPGIHQCAVASFQSWAQCSSAGVLTEGLRNFFLGTYVSGGQSSLAARQCVVMTRR